jgi:hypothetical protein
MIIIEVDGVSVEETTTIENANPAEPDGTP